MQREGLKRRGLNWVFLILENRYTYTRKGKHNKFVLLTTTSDVKKVLLEDIPSCGLACISHVRSHSTSHGSAVRNQGCPERHVEVPRQRRQFRVGFVIQ